MPNPVTTENEQILWIAKIFYRCKKKALPRGFGCDHKLWDQFRQARAWMMQLGTLDKGKYKTYISAQFHYAPRGDKNRVYPTMLHCRSATKRWRKYLEKKKRRTGDVMPRTLEYEKGLSTNRIEAVFMQGAWDLEGYLHNGFREDEAIKAFEPLFDPAFVIASPGASLKLKDAPDYFGPRVKAVYEHIKKRRQALQDLRTLYGKCREEQGARWPGRFGLRAPELEDV